MNSNSISDEDEVGGGRGRRGGGGRSGYSGRGREGGGRGGGRGGGNRRRGGSGRGGERHSNPHQQQQQQQQRQRQAAQSAAPPPKLNGQKGAEAHTVSETDRIRLTKILISLREDETRDRIELSSDLTNTERKFVHQLAGQLGLKSKSSGKGDERRIAISKPSQTKKIAGQSLGSNNESTSNTDKDLPSLKLGKKGIIGLTSHITKFPPKNEMERMESYCTGSYLLKIAKDGGNHNKAEEEKEDVIEGNEENIKNKESVNNDDSLLHALDDLNLHTHSSTSSTITPKNHKSKYSTTANIQKRIQLHHSSQSTKIKQSQYKQILTSRQNLPAYSYAAQICDTISKNTVTILSGDTGCGKSTQVPQFLLDDPTIGPTANIIVTQPRRISAISLAERVSYERCEEVGKTVGYNVRLDGCLSNQTQCLFVTPGVLLRKFRSTNAQEDDEILSDITHVILDEIHERDRYTDFLMIALRDLIQSGKRVDLKVILMSATIQTNALMKYWNGVGIRNDIERPLSCTVENGDIQEEEEEEEGKEEIIVQEDFFLQPAEISIPGRTYPVQEFFLEDVLSMTNYIQHNNTAQETDMQRIEQELSTLIQTKQEKALVQYWHSQHSPPPGKQRRRRHQQQPSKRSATAPVMTIGNSHSLTCIMCSKSNFRSPEELGTHVALCDGGGDGSMTMEELEEKVRSVDPNAIMGFDDVRVDVGGGSEDKIDGVEDKEWEDYEEEDDVMQESNSADDDDDMDDDAPGLKMGKWDGESPFGVADILSHASTSKITLTEEEMLSQYQTMHDDEQIDDTLLFELLKYIVESSYGDGAVLIFFPGWQEITEFQMLLESTPPFHDVSKFSVLLLHSGIPSKDQRKVFQRCKGGVRKIVLATNIAETSVTIDDVAFVVDTGRAKEKNYDPHLKTSTLQPVWISQASAKQRKGRAGRTKAGVCFHLFSRRRYASFRLFTESELLRTPLEELCLQCKKLALAPGGPEDVDGIPAFLSKALTPPHPKSITNALDLLVELGAMDSETNELTDLGQCLSVLSLEPRVGKMVIWSHILGCAKASSSMAVAMSYKSPFVLPPASMRRAADSAKVELSDRSESDQITILNVLRIRDKLHKSGRQNSFFNFCRSNFLSPPTMQMVSDLRKNVARELVSLGFPSPTDAGYHNRNGDSDPAFLQATIAAGLYPNVASRKQGEVNFSTMTNRKAKVHISSLNSCKSQPLSSKCQLPRGEVEFVIFGEMVRGVASFTMNQTTHLASALPLLLLCGKLCVRPANIVTKTNDDEDKGGEEIVPNKAVLSVDDWIVFLCDKELAAALVVLRRRLDGAFQHMVSNASLGLDALNDAEKDAVSTLGTLLKSAHRAAPAR